MAQPEKTFRMGLVSASVFVNEYEFSDGKRKSRRERRSVVLQRSYKDGDDWKQTNSFGLGDLPAAIRVLELAQNHVESQEVESVPHPDADHVTQHTDYLRQERGLSPKTIALVDRTLRQFLAMIEEAKLRLKTLTVAQVDELLAKLVHGERYSRSTIQRWASALRTFFRFAEERNWCRPGLSTAIMSPRVYRHEGLPQGPSWDDVKRLIAAAEGA